MHNLSSLSFSEDKDPEKTDILMKSIEHVGQSDPAIITCDGFLINGNRRKMVLEETQEPEIRGRQSTRP